MSQSNDRQKMLQTLESQKDALLALGDEVARRPWINGARAQELSRRVLDAIGSLTSALKEEFSQARVEKIEQAAERVSTQAMVFYAAELLSQNPWSDTQQERFQALAEIVKEHDAFLYKWAWALLGEHPVHAPVLFDIRANKGFRDDANDTLRLVSLLRQQWKEASQIGFLTEERLEQAEADATEFIQLIDTKENVDSGEPKALWYAAFGQWYQTYSTLTKAGRFLLDDKEAELQFPGVSMPKKSTSTHTTTPTTDDPTPPTPPI